MLKQFEWDLGFLEGYEEDYSDGSEINPGNVNYTNMELEKIKPQLKKPSKSCKIARSKQVSTQSQELWFYDNGTIKFKFP